MANSVVTGSIQCGLLVAGFFVEGCTLLHPPINPQVLAIQRLPHAQTVHVFVDDPQWVALMQRGDRALANGHPQLAAQSYEQAVAIARAGGNEAEARLKLADVYEQSGNYAEALRELRFLLGYDYVQNAAAQAKFVERIRTLEQRAQQTESRPAATGPVQTEEHPPSESWVTYTQAVHHIKLSYPAAWFKKEHINPGTYQLFLSREQVEKPGDVFLVGVSLMKIDQADSRLQLGTHDSSTAASVFLERYLKNIATPVTKRAINRPVQLGGEPAYLSDVAFRDVFGKDIRGWVVIAYRDDTMTTINLEAPQHEFERYQSVFERFIAEAHVVDTMASSALTGQTQLHKQIAGDTITIPELNVVITRPQGWKTLQFDDWHGLAAFSKDDPPTIASPLIAMNVVPLLGRRLEALAQDVALQKAAGLNQRALIKLGAPEPMTLGIFSGFEEMYGFSVDKAPLGFLYFFTAQGELAYVFTYSNAFDRTGADIPTFRQMIANVRALDAKTTVSAQTVQRLVQAETALQVVRNPAPAQHAAPHPLSAPAVSARPTELPATSGPVAAPPPTQSQPLTEWLRSPPGGFYSSHAIQEIGLAAEVHAYNVLVHMGARTRNVGDHFPLAQGHVTWYAKLEPKFSWKPPTYRAVWSAPDGSTVHEEYFSFSKVDANLIRSKLSWDPTREVLKGTWRVEVFENGKTLDRRTFVLE